MAQQQSMFGHEDLPLFSGTAPRATVERFAPQPTAPQMHLGQCPICEDTGLVRDGDCDHFCTCPAGVALHDQRRQQEDRGNC